MSGTPRLICRSGVNTCLCPFACVAVDVLVRGGYYIVYHEDASCVHLAVLVIGMVSRPVLRACRWRGRDLALFLVWFQVYMLIGLFSGFLHVAISWSARRW